MTTMQGWAVHLSEIADHTYVGNGNGPNSPSQYYACWGVSYAPGNLLICSGNGNTAIANRYRDSLLGFPDTAGIGIYAVDGVCHQSANCFLLSANVELTLAVRGYWLTVLAYGPYGNLFPSWLLSAYAWCCFWNGGLISEGRGAPTEPTVADKVRNLFSGYITKRQPPTPHEAIISQAEIVGRHFVPELDPASYHDLQARYLKDKDSVVAKGQTGKPLADDLNDLSKKLQTDLANRLGDTVYYRLTGFEGGETVDIIEHAAAAGRRPPPKDMPS